jgi:AbrB family looped-hinge helix DNA binding protein
MAREVTIDGAGRVTLPKALRLELHLESRDTLRIEAHGEQITLQPLRLTAPIGKEAGIWVYRSGQTTSLSIAKLIDDGRDERHLKNLGLDRCQRSRKTDPLAIIQN